MPYPLGSQMRWWKSRRRNKTIDDPALGSLELRDGEWCGQATFPGEEGPALLSVRAGPAGPGEPERLAYARLLAALPSQADSIAAALFELYRPYLDLPVWDGPPASSATQLRALLELSAIIVSGTRPAELIFGFRGDRWPDATFVLEFDGAQIRPVSLDD
jgi:hypothetical protein